MGKGRKRKHGELSQEEIWDDSALLRSWQDAMEEYQFYHSIRARGEDVEEILRQAQLDDNAKNQTAKTASAQEGHAILNDDMEDGEVDEGGDLEASEQATEFLGEQVPMRAHSSEAHHRGPNVTENDTANASASMDQGQILENIKMAYWWAGYYSALYDAQQTAHHPPEN